MKAEILELINKAKTSNSLFLENISFTDEIWEEIVKLTDLIILNIKKSEIEKIPEFISNLVKLEYLSITNCNLNFFPISITAINSLISIELDKNKIPKIPKEISNLKYLNRISLINNQLTEIPKEISKIKRMEYLNFENNQITNISPEIFKLKKLNTLNVINNKIKNIKNIPNEISELTNLQYFKIADNPIEALKFFYIISDYDNNFKNEYNEFRFEKKEPDIFNFNQLKLEITYRDKFIFLKNIDNYCFIELFDQPNRINNNKDISKPNFYENFLQYQIFMIYVFGNIETQKEFLTKIRNHFDNWMQKKDFQFGIYKKHEKSETFVSRFFYYPINEKYDNETTINYDKLLKLNEAKDNVYIDDNFGKKIPIIDLLKYIGAENDKLKKEWNGTNYITNFQIKDFKIFKNIKLNLSKNINIILGNNGLGKTSVLQAITLGLLPIENNDYPDNLNEFINFNSKKSDIIINWGENENRKLFIFPQGKPAEEEPITPPLHLLLAYGVNFNTNKEQDHTKIVNELIEGERNLYFTKSIFEDNYRNLYDPLVILKYLDDKIITSKGLNIETIKERVLKELGTKKISDKTISKQISVVTSEIVLINQLLLNTLNEYLSLIEKSEQIQIVYYEDDHRYYFTDLYDNKLELRHLSEGYKDHVLLITDILVRILSAREKLLEKEKKITINKELFKKIKAIILIDEFDRHLHPSWQRKLLSKFKEDFPNVQFILTTHNPMSILDRDADEIIELKTDETRNIISRTHLEGTKYLDISKIYLKYFVKDIVSTELHDDIEKYNELLISNKTSLDEFKHLETKLKNANIGYYINDLRYWKFLDFLKRFPDKDPTKNNENAGDWDFIDEEWNNLLNEINS